MRGAIKMDKSFKALIVNKTDDDFALHIKELTLDDLPAGDVLIKVAYSSVNYKDGLASIPNGKIVRSYPFIPGIDLAGVVVDSQDPRFKEGDKVIATSYEIGVSHYGGDNETAPLPRGWTIALPKKHLLNREMDFFTDGLKAAVA